VVSGYHVKTASKAVTGRGLFGALFYLTLRLEVTQRHLGARVRPIPPWKHCRTFPTSRFPAFKIPVASKFFRSIG
jgi:hypothetical protein